MRNKPETALQELFSRVRVGERTKRNPDADVDDLTLVQISSRLVQHVTGDYTVPTSALSDGGLILARGLILVDSTAAPLTITLPTVTTITVSTLLVIKDSSGAAVTNTITIDGDGTETIDGATTRSISSALGARQLMADPGLAWYMTT